jgi:hypothetical protein
MSGESALGELLAPLPTLIAIPQARLPPLSRLGAAQPSLASAGG